MSWFEPRHDRTIRDERPMILNCKMKIIGVLANHTRCMLTSNELKVSC